MVVKQEGAPSWLYAHRTKKLHMLLLFYKSAQIDFYINIFALIDSNATL